MTTQIEDQSVHEVYFKSYIDLAKEDQISWDKFVTLMDTFTPTFSKCKILISILLQEVKSYKDSKSNLANGVITIKDESNDDQRNRNRDVIVENKIMHQQEDQNVNEPKSVQRKPSKGRSIWKCKFCFKNLISHFALENHACKVKNSPKNKKFKYEDKIMKEKAKQNDDDVIEVESVGKARTGNRIRSTWKCRPCAKFFSTQRDFVDHP